MINKKYKYPRTYHIPCSDVLKNDDSKYPDMSIFDGKNVVVSIKMNGDNTTWYSDNIHARSIDSQNSNYPSRDYVKRLWSIRYEKIMFVDPGKIQRIMRIYFDLLQLLLYMNVYTMKKR